MKVYLRERDQCASPSPSSILSHHLETGHSVTLDDFGILISGLSPLDLTIRGKSIY